MVRKRRVIIVDDNPRARSSLKRHLMDRHSDFDVVGEAENTIDGLNLIKTENPDGAFIDINIQSQSERAGLDFAGIPLN